MLIYGLKVALDLWVYRKGFNKKIITDKIRTLGSDLFWIGVMASGAIIIKDSSQHLETFFSTYPICRLLVPAFVIAAIVITVLKRVEEGISANNPTGIMRIRQGLLVCILVFLMILIGLSNFALVFWLISLS
jgi:uncharacterized protein YacL